MLVLGFVLSYGFSYAQTPASCCPQKGTADCPLLKNCPKKGTKDCPYAVSTASLVAKNVKGIMLKHGKSKIGLIFPIL